jgi:hypothetical protein
MSSTSVVCRLLGGSGQASLLASAKPNPVPALCKPRPAFTGGVVVVPRFVPLPLAA